MSELGLLWPYSERNSFGVEADLATLLAPPEIQLSADERVAASAFADGLFKGHLDAALHLGGSWEEAAEQPPTLESIYRTDTGGDRLEFYADYFRGRADQADLLAGFLTGTDEGATRLDELKKIEGQSRDWYRELIAERLKADPTRDAMQHDSPVMNMNLSPPTLLKKFGELQAYRQFYRDVRLALRQEPPSSLDTAKTVLLDLHVGRVNTLVAELYPAVMQLSEQLASLPQTAEIVQLQSRLQTIVPVAARAFGRRFGDRTAFMDDFARRLDLVRNGAASDEDDRLSPVSTELRQLAATLEETDKHSEFTAPTALSEKLNSIKWDAAQLKTFWEAILEEWGLLSGAQIAWEQADDRSGFAEDEKWQVVITPRKTALAVNGSKKIVWIPEKFLRTLTQNSPAGGLPITAHELTHVLQTEYDLRLGRILPLARIKGRRYVTMREIGGIHQERELFHILGKGRPTNTTYLRAQEAKLKGGNQTEAARAFHDAKIGNAERTEAALSRARAAAKNVLRLYRYAGHNSQPLDYIEQDLLLLGLSSLSASQIRAVAVAGGSFSLKDMVQLHRIGLLDLPQQIPEQPAQDVWRIFMKRFYVDA